MKKILLFACAAVMAFASCGNKTAAPAETVDSDSVAVSEVAQAAADSLEAIVSNALQSADPAQIKGALATLQTAYAQLVKEGKLEDAKTYASKIQEFINSNTETITKVANGDATITSLLNGIKNLPTSAETTAEEAAAAVSTDAQSLADAAKTAVTAAVNEKVDEAKAAAVKKATEAVAPAVEKATAAKKTVDDAKAKVDEKKSQAQAVGAAAKALLGK